MMDLRVRTERLDMAPLTLQEIEALIAGAGVEHAGAARRGERRDAARRRRRRRRHRRGTGLRYCRSSIRRIGLTRSASTSAVPNAMALTSANSVGSGIVSYTLAAIPAR